MPKNVVIRVFEHQVIRVGDQLGTYRFTQADQLLLARFYDRHQGKYYRLVHRGIQFSHYVGALQVGNLTIEILPKIDRHQNDTAHWHRVLLDMLRYCRLLKVDALTSAHLRLRSNAILELYFDVFLTEVEGLLRRGLCKAYHLQAGNRNYWKGKLLFDRHIALNYVQQQRFYTEHDIYDYDHIANRMLYQALQILQDLLVDTRLFSRLQKILAHFPPLSPMTIREKDFEQIRYTRKLVHYQTALEIARLLLLNYSPDIRGGQHHALAILFDMNLLFEEYLYQQLLRLQNEGLKVERQRSQNFWQRRKIRPDLLVEYQGQRYVLDTKWKVLQKAQPSVEDLKQMFVYCRFFAAKQAVLLYPKANDLINLAPQPYQEPGADPCYCSVFFLEVIQNGQLNRQLGAELLKCLVPA